MNETVHHDGVERVTTDVRDLASGYYVVRMVARRTESKAAKFVVRR